MEPADWIAIAIFGALLLAVLLWGHRREPEKTGSAKCQIAIDGTNVLFWRDNMAQISTLKAVLKHLRSAGYDPVVFLDASSRHHLGDKSLSETKFAQVLGVAQNRIMVCPARTEADAFILQYAGEQKLAVVSNDRFRDRRKEARNVRLIKGRFQGERLVLKNF